MLRFLREMTPFPELKAVQVGPVQRFDADCRDLVPENAKELQLRLEDRVTAQDAEDAAEPAVAAAEEESPEEDPVVEPDAQQVEKMRVLGQPGFDIEIQGAVATVLGDEHEIYQAGVLLQRLEQECRLLLHKDGRKCGEPGEVTMVPEMVYDRRGGQAFDVHGKIAAVRRVVLRTPVPEKLLGFP